MAEPTTLLPSTLKRRSSSFFMQSNLRLQKLSRWPAQVSLSPSISRVLHWFYKVSLLLHPNRLSETLKETQEMEQVSHVGSREIDLKRSFKLGLHGLLTTCSKEEFCKSFPRFTRAETERLYQLYIQVIVSLHQNIEDEFEALCEETKVGDILGTVDELVEEQTTDPLYLDKTNLNDVAQVLSKLKKNGIQNITTMLEKLEAQNKLLRSRIELLHKEIQDSAGEVRNVE